MKRRNINRKIRAPLETGVGDMTIHPPDRSMQNESEVQHLVVASPNALQLPKLGAHTRETWVVAIPTV